MKATATLPDGTTRPLIWIKEWDFNWQDEYRYVEPVYLPKGTAITMRYVYDNSSANPRQSLWLISTASMLQGRRCAAD